MKVATSRDAIRAHYENAMRTGHLAIRLRDYNPEAITADELRAVTGTLDEFTIFCGSCERSVEAGVIMDDSYTWTADCTFFCADCLDQAVALFSSHIATAHSGDSR